MTALLWYLLIINIFTLVVYGLDKRQARRHRGRISERKLLGLAAIGGTIGAWLAQQGFRHKTQKRSFRIIFAVIVLVQVGMILWMCWTRSG